MSETADSPLQIRRTVLQQLESLRRCGVRDLGKPQAVVPATSERDEAIKPAVTTRTDMFQQSSSKNMPRQTREQRQSSLEVIQQEVAQCTLCSELAETRTQTVFGVGNPSPRLVFLGEAPGADEDRQGEPFVGAAGKLLTKIIEACTLRREDVYILNVLKCRPPGNRNPNPNEAENCRPFLDRQLEVLRPEYICCLGSIAAQNLLATKQSIGKMRGRFYTHGDFKVLVTYHPAYLLRNPSAKKDVWEDMKLLMRDMGIKIP